jgi:hypothetical protein
MIKACRDYDIYYILWCNTITNTWDRLATPLLNKHSIVESSFLCSIPVCQMSCLTAIKSAHIKMLCFLFEWVSLAIWHSLNSFEFWYIYFKTVFLSCCFDPVHTVSVQNEQLFYNIFECPSWYQRTWWSNWWLFLLNIPQHEISQHDCEILLNHGKLVSQKQRDSRDQDFTFILSDFEPL